LLAIFKAFKSTFVNDISIYEGRLFVCFVCQVEISQITTPLVVVLVCWKASMSKGVPSWFHNVLNYYREGIENWKTFSLNHLNQT
jgi:hypothetical protein